MATALIQITMGPSIKVIGKMINKMDRGVKSGPMVVITLGIICAG
jgi:hypothetical protein